MLRTTLAGLRAHRARLLLTAAAIVLGVAFLAGTLVYGDTAKAAFYDDLARAARHVDVQVGPAGVDTIAETSRRVGFDVVDRIRAVPGVARADGRIAQRLPMLDPGGRLIANAGLVGWAVSVPGDPALAMYDLTAGRLPIAPGEVAVDRATVDGQGFRLGWPVTVLDDAQRPVRLTLVGVIDLGANRRFSGGTVAALTNADLHRLVHPGGYAEVVVTAAPGVAQNALAERIRTTLDPWYRVLTGDEWRHDLAVTAAKYVDGFLAVMVAFSLVALAVCGFVIHNTFGILVAQRARELALLRCVGASRRQLFGSVVVESTVTGALASAAGLAFSLVFGYALLVARDTVGNGAPIHGLVVAPATAGLAVLAGTAVTVLAAIGPAVTAGRVAPVAVVRTVSAPPGRRELHGRLVAAGVLAAAGALAILAGERRAFAGIPLVFTGAVGVLAAVVVVSPLVVPRLVGFAGAVPARLGVPARLAVANARRNPRRVAATTGALLVGLALMSMVSVLLSTAKAQTRRELDENFPVDYAVTGAYTGGAHEVGVPLAAARALRASPDVAAAAGCRISDDGSTVNGRPARLWAGEPGGLTGALRPEVMSGALPDPHPGGVALNRFFAASVHAGVGDPVTVAVGGATARRLTVVALYDDTPVDAPALLDWSDYTALFGAGPPDRIVVKARDGVPPAVSRRAVEAALRPYPLAQVASSAQERAQLDGALDRQLGILGSLLGVSIVIGLAGIANTLSLSVLERTGESALLRALGLRRGQLRAMLVVEALLIAVVGGVLGIGLGAGVGAVASLGLIRAYGHGGPVLPVGQFALYLGLAAAAGALAAVLPARRAARTPVAATLASG